MPVTCLRTAMVCVLVLILCKASGGHSSPRAAQAAGQQYDSLWRQSTVAHFRAWVARGVAVGETMSGAALRLAPQRTVPLPCASGDVDGGRARYSAAAGLCLGHDPLPAGGYRRRLSYYNGGDFYYGSALSPVHRPSQPVDHLIASWNADTPPGTWLEVRARMQEGSGWTGWYVLGVWASDFSAIHRHSVDHQRDPGGGVDTDTFRTAPDRVVSAYQLSVTLFTASVTVSPVIRSVAVVASHDAPVYAPMRADRSVWGRDLPVPPRSQMLLRYRGLAFGGGGEAWCSPTSTSMVMAYWATRLRRPGLYRTVPEAARGTYDATYDGTGNWPFNVAYAASFGLTGFVTRMVSMSQVEQWIKVGVPIVISIAFRYGELPGEPLQASAGHLVVVRGFTRTGDVVTNDPGAATDAGTRIVFPRSILERVWQDGSHGTAYVLYPPGWATPSTEGHKLVRTMAPVTRAGWIGMRR